MTGQWTRRASAVGADALASRGARFAARAAGRVPPSLAALRRVPTWQVLDPPEQRRFAAVVGLLHHRAGLQSELRGAVLAPLAALVGEDVFDRLCAMPLLSDAADTKLPGPAALVASGQDLLGEAELSRADDYALQLAREVEDVLRYQRSMA